MDEYISREEVINITAETGAWETQNRVRELPAADVQPVKHGRWERRMTKIYACSECTNEVTDRQRKNYSFCPYCGALMNVVYEDDKVRAIKVVGLDGDNDGKD